MSPKRAVCKDFVAIMEFKNGEVDANDLDEQFAAGIQCVRVVIGSKQRTWISISEIAIFTTHNYIHERPSNVTIVSKSLKGHNNTTAISSSASNFNNSKNNPVPAEGTGTSLPFLSSQHMKAAEAKRVNAFATTNSAIGVPPTRATSTHNDVYPGVQILSQTPKMQFFNLDNASSDARMIEVNEIPVRSTYSSRNRTNRARRRASLIPRSDLLRMREKYGAEDLNHKISKQQISPEEENELPSSRPDTYQYLLQIPSKEEAHEGVNARPGDESRLLKLKPKSKKFVLNHKSIDVRGKTADANAPISKTTTPIEEKVPGGRNMTQPVYTEPAEAKTVNVRSNAKRKLNFAKKILTARDIGSRER